MVDPGTVSMVLEPEQLSMSSKQYSAGFFKGPAYALVIGISRYEHGKDQLLEDQDFLNLKCAAQDAKDFAEFLKHNGCIPYNVQGLFDDQAKRETIIDELEKLKEYCRQRDAKNPLVILYFSGHGFADNQGRHYLAPYNVERDRLPATALPNKEFNNHLAEIETNRLVVFIDACHSGAVVMEDGARGEVTPYDVHEGLGDGAGRYVIASCESGQRSYELGDNGIFTGELLKLLKCETDDLEDEVEIDIFPLFCALEKRVSRAAQSIKKVQQPTADIRSATGIVLAINEKLLKKRLAAEQHTSDEKLKFFEAIRNLIQKADCDQYSISVMLREYVSNGKTTDGYTDLYGCFDERFKRWNRGDTSRLDLSCQLLIDSYKYAEGSNKESKTADASQSSDALVKKAENKVLGTPASKAPPIPTAAGPPQPKRQFSTAQCDYILGERILTPEYYPETTTLLDLLEQPVSEVEFSRTVQNIRSKRKGDEAFARILEAIVARFSECWEQAETVEPKTQTIISSLMMERGP